ncbi:hypothetical protein DM992_06055 [Burkholderia sp. JP2-270]|uniref:hypothetical protein n=1 Tax=Burkholderia sp. JP2-270 TaxID=2217913 RepID=UPI000DA403EA|nr:hypothetical protein [Burkholderia sp. JP2-270]AWU99167.1 hypothetical protein DM992_06055 [Burkholderia sp. JP2-270]
MIKIQRHIDSDPKVALRKIRALAEGHWLFMNKIKNAGDPLDKNSLVERCKSMRDDLANKKFLTDNKLSADDALKAKSLLDILLRGNSHLLRRLVVDSPENLDKLRKQLERVVPPPVLWKLENGVVAQTKIGKLFTSRVFRYEWFRESKYCAELYDKAMNSNLFTCVYCNLEKIYVADISSVGDPVVRRRAYMDIDHFFPKSKYPYMAISFFNLIPCCHNCNSRAKLVKEFTLTDHVHPYVKNFDDLYEFSYDHAKLASGEKQFLRIRHRSVSSQVDKTAGDLNLLNRYNSDTTDFREMIEQYHVHRALFSKNLGAYEKMFQTWFPKNGDHILRKSQSKALRDVFISIDGENLLKSQLI